MLDSGMLPPRFESPSPKTLDVARDRANNGLLRLRLGHRDGHQPIRDFDDIARFWRLARLGARQRYGIGYGARRRLFGFPDRGDLVCGCGLGGRLWLVIGFGRRLNGGLRCAAWLWRRLLGRRRRKGLDGIERNGRRLLLRRLWILGLGALAR